MFPKSSWHFALAVVACFPLLTKEDILCPVEGNSEIYGFTLEESKLCFTMINLYVGDEVVDLHEANKDKCKEYPGGEIYNFLQPEQADPHGQKAFQELTKPTNAQKLLITSVRIHSTENLHQEHPPYDKSHGKPFKTAEKYFMSVGKKGKYDSILGVIGDHAWVKPRGEPDFPICVFMHLSERYGRKLIQCKLSPSEVMTKFPNTKFGVMCKHPAFSNCESWGQHYCNCKIGFKGKYCNVEVCAPSLCQHGGTCESHGQRYFCRCAPGWSGRNCEIKVTSCKDQPCEGKSSCTDILFYYVCHCAPDRTGMNCEVEANPCRSSPCRNGGICFAPSNAVFSCTCKAPYTGDTCESIIPGAEETMDLSATLLFAAAFVPSLIIATILSLCFIQENTKFGKKSKLRSAWEQGTSRMLEQFHRSVTGRKAGGASFTLTRNAKLSTTRGTSPTSARGTSPTSTRGTSPTSRRR